MVDGSLFFFATGLKQESEGGLRPRRPLARFNRTNPDYVFRHALIPAGWEKFLADGVSLFRLGFFDLPVFEVHEGIATEDANGNTEFASLGINFLNETVLVLERSIGHLDLITDFEMDFRFHRIFAVTDLSEKTLHFLRTHGNRAVLCTSKPENACGVFDEIPRLLDELVVFIEEVHIDNQIAGKKLASRLGLFASLDFLHALGWDEDLVNEFGHFIGDDSAVDIVFHFLLLSGEDVHDEPLIFRG